MGGSFIALSDDATAVEYNPAGLWQLRRPEIAGQFVYTHDRRRTPLFLQSLPGEPAFQTDEDDYVFPSFFSVVVPTPHVALGLSQFTNVYLRREYVEAYREFSHRVEEEATNRAWGLTAATGLLDRLSVGLTLRYNTFAYEFEDSDFGRSEFRDEAFSFNLGALWRVNRFLSLGVVYKSPQPLKGQFRNNPVDTELPDTFGAGIAIHPDDRWRILFDIDRIRWSRFGSDPSGELSRDDVWRYHAGAEVHAGTWKDMNIFLRGGYMVEESNAVQYHGPDPDLAALIRSDDSVNHYSVGFGLGFPRFQLDFGADLADNGSYDLITSFVFYL